MSGIGSNKNVFCVACQSLKKGVFFETWPYIAEWIKSNRNERGRLVEQMYQRQGKYPLQVAFYRLRLAVLRRRQERSQEDPQNPTDPYLGWDDFFWLDTLEGPNTAEEEWAWKMWTFNSARQEEEERDNFSNENVPWTARQGRFRWVQWYAPHRFQDQVVAEGERIYAEAERIRLQPNNDYELHMSDIELAELRQRRLDYVDESDVEGSHSSAEDTTLLWGRTPTSQDEADLEAHEARVASDADWLEQNMRWHEDARQE
jgi:hypothetical protein